MKKYGYVRVSTKKQLKGNSVEEQTESILEKYPEAEIIVESMSGAKKRPKFEELLDRLRPNDFLICTKLDRFCRTTKEGLEYIDRLRSNGIHVHILNMGLIEDTPVGQLIVTQLLAFAEFERSQIIERCQSGKEIAKQSANFRDGRPKIYGKEQINHALELWEKHSTREVMAKTGISRATLFRAKKKKQEELQKEALKRHLPY